MFSEIPSQMVMTACLVIGIPMLLCFVDLFIFGRKRRKQLDSDPNCIRLYVSLSDYRLHILKFIILEGSTAYTAVYKLGASWPYSVIKETGKIPATYYDHLYHSGDFNLLLAISLCVLCLLPYLFIDGSNATLYMTKDAVDLRTISLIRYPGGDSSWNRINWVKIYNESFSESGIKKVVIDGIFRPTSRSNKTALTISGNHPKILEIVGRLKLYAPDKISYL